jgi:toxin secretion/phage lysis holin
VAAVQLNGANPCCARVVPPYGTRQIGVMCAVIEKKLSSEIGAKGIFKKVLIFALVGVGHVIDSQILGDAGVLRTAVIFFYLSNEGISILENVALIGLPVPQKLKDVLAQLNSKTEEDKR